MPEKEKIPDYLDPGELAREMFSTGEKLFKGMDLLMSLEDIDVGASPKETVFEEDKMRVYHYKSDATEVCKVPVLVCYALVNKQYMMDLQSDRSLVRNLLSNGIDLYMIDWGYPDEGDRYVSLEDYIEVYLNDAVDFVREASGQDKINLLGVCQGGTFTVIYSALHPEKIQNLITMVAPVDFDTTDGLLNVWSRYLDVEKMVDAMGVVPGDFMNVGFLMLKPFQLMLDKYVGLLENLDNKDVVENFVRMEKWIFDSPAQAGQCFIEFIEELYKKNKLVKNKLEVGGRKVDLKKITMPLLNIYARDDHLVPPASSIPLNDLVGSKDKRLITFPGGHIGIYVSSRSQKELAPTVATWLKDRCGTVRNKKPTKKKAKKKAAGRKKAAKKKPAAKKPAGRKKAVKKKPTTKKPAKKKAAAKKKAKPKKTPAGKASKKKASSKARKSSNK